MPKVPAPSDISLSRIARRKQKTKHHLLEVARRLFSEKGIYWAKVEDITELADLGKGTFYKYFDSKETIIQVLLEEGLGELLSKTDQAVRDTSSNSRILSSVIGARVDFFLTYPDYLLLFHQVRGLMQLQGNAAKDLREVYDAHLRRLAQLIKPSLGPGAAVSTREAALATAAYTSGLLTYHILFEGQEGIRRKREYFVAVIEESIRALLRTGKPAQAYPGKDREPKR